MGKAQEILEDSIEFSKFAKMIFRQVDLDHTGYIDESNLELFMNNIAVQNDSPRPSHDDIKRTIKEVNKKGDGHITFDEFKVLIEHILTSLAQHE